MWSYYDAYLSSARDVLGLRLQIYEKYESWERSAKLGGFRWMHPKFCMVCDFPDVLLRDEQNRPHCDTGPSHRWSDGWSLYFVHGVRVPEFVIERPHEITAGLIERESNAEVRRVMLDKFGRARYMRESGATLVDSLPDNYFLKGLQGAKLYRKERADDEPLVMLEMNNSTPEPDGSIKQYMLQIDPSAYNGEAAKQCHAAMASTWRYENSGELVFKRPQDYRPGVES